MPPSKEFCPDPLISKADAGVGMLQFLLVKERTKEGKTFLQIRTKSIQSIMETTYNLSTYSTSSSRGSFSLTPTPLIRLIKFIVFLNRFETNKFSPTEIHFYVKSILPCSPRVIKI